MNFNNNGSSIFGVFDGHGGPLVSKFSAQNFQFIFKESLLKSNSVENALIESFLKLDELLKQDSVNKFLREIDTKMNNQNYYDTSSYQFLFDTKGQLVRKNSYQSLKAAFDCNSSFIDSTKSGKSSSIGDMSELYDKSLKGLGNDKSTSCNSSSISNEKDNNATSFNEAILKSFKPERKFTKLLKQKELVAKNMGTTANVIYIFNNKLYVANVGDSFAVMYKNKQAIKLNIEHKITVKSEEERILKSGCKVINNRIEGKLNLTRAIGKDLINILFYY